VYTPEPLLIEDTAPVVNSHPRIAGIGAALPERVVSNAQIAARAGVDEQWILKRTGIRNRRHADPDLELLDLATTAAEKALADAERPARATDLVIFATVSQRQPMPNLAPQLAARIGAAHAGAFDLGAACNGFISGLATAAAYIESGRARQVLLLAADMLSRQTDPTDRTTAALFGDGAAAVLLAAGREGTPWTIELGSDGACAGLIENDRSTGLIRMQGHETFIHAVARMEEATRGVCETAGTPLHEVDLFVFHQANARITSALTERLQIPADSVVDAIAELGNTSAASVPLALEQARAEGRLGDASRVLLCAVGAGFTWGAALIDGYGR
jgi:3-oxoacyl-[acyl-carrier-protein] synthase-3